MNEEVPEGMMMAIFQAPTDPAEKDAWAMQMVRIQFAMFVDDGAECAHCHVPYASTDDMINRSPKRGYDDDKFVDVACWDDYMKGHQDAADE